MESLPGLLLAVSLAGKTGLFHDRDGVVAILDEGLKINKVDFHHFRFSGP
jgi:hypothetical protein